MQYKQHLTQACCKKRLLNIVNCMKNRIKILSLANAWMTVLAIMTMASCTKYDITGSSDLSSVDGRMLYLRPLTGDDERGLDSCDVVHGKFKFSGALDSVQVVMLCIDNDAVIPVVLEDGKIQVEVNLQKQRAMGTPLNDSLTAFNTRYQQLMMQAEDLEHQHNQAILNGEDLDAVSIQLLQVRQELAVKEDKLITSFIADNFDNCLAPYVFLMATSVYQYPMLTPWIEALMTKATPTFKNNPIVSSYMKSAQYNQDVMTGVADVDSNQMPPPPSPNATAPTGWQQPQADQQQQQP